MNFLDLFAGIGGFRLGMEQAGHQCIGFCEIDEFARRSYKAIHDTRKEVEMHDITSVSDEFVRSLGPVDILCGGFPCQAFSIAGKRQGFSDTRGTLFFEIARFAALLRPKLLFLENVRGLLNHKGGATFETILRTLDGLGYDVEWQVLNSKAYVPQSRERVFLIGHSRDACTEQVFPIIGSSTTSDQNIRNLVNINPSNRGMGGQVYGSDGVAPTLTGDEGSKIALPANEGISVAGMLPGNFEQGNRVYEVTGTAPTLSTKQGGTKIMIRKNKTEYQEVKPGDSVNLAFPNSTSRRGRLGKQSVHTLLTGDQQAIVTDQYQIRKLTPRECWRLQGFPDWVFDRASRVNSDSQLYKQAGNSVTVPVIFDIARRLKEVVKHDL
ncbi:MAG: DNA (cytosine-5-)-methyltransferase [Enterococcus sp.]|nr:DNA (cytosine-5-)-methyltransferase [Enterococcus sp.]MCP94961.1 DNA (cytosine-5-)-methyltransferase [Listeria monocytogenes]HAQ0153136.1 DNA (cytosine-5-)-methyltransferase [Enterococcus faecium]MDN6215965.1 DNA (cytosine-5-)-methyltransferase [Enterococcus sp.]MDN6561681.1 DNA (cytosine-5-)-methyltransferase [Enterococcus sp.]MDN6616393.1 DNA (cytosine-5-)-methyltransferase [Enterococcus sp.]